MASFFKRLFNSQERDITPQIAPPVNTALQVPGGKRSFDILNKRVGGEGVGFGARFAERQSNPIIQNLRSRFQGRTLPELRSELSRTGRRRGTGGFDQIRRAVEQQGLTEGDVFSRLEVQNQQQGRNEINQALSDLQNFAQRETQLRQAFSNFQLGLNDRQVAEANRQKTAEAQGLQRLVQAAASAAGGFIGGPVGAAAGSGGFNSTFRAPSGQTFRPSAPPPGALNRINLAARNTGQLGRVR